MQVIGDYHADGFAVVRGLIPRDVARAYMTRLKQATGGQALPVNRPQQYPAVLARPAFDVSSKMFPPMDFFLWGLTPVIGQLVGHEVLPTYNYFRIYREGDICRIHSDRPASEHGVSLTLEYSDEKIWDFQIGRDRTETLYPLSNDFGAEEFASIGMEVGDAVLYQANHYPHGRVQPNPNRWSAHLFLFFVDQQGPHRGHAFDGEMVDKKVNFSFS